MILLSAVVERIFTHSQAEHRGRVMKILSFVSNKRAIACSY